MQYSGSLSHDYDYLWKNQDIKILFALQEPSTYLSSFYLPYVPNLHHSIPNLPLKIKIQLSNLLMPLLGTLTKSDADLGRGWYDCQDPAVLELPQIRPVRSSTPTWTPPRSTPVALDTVRVDEHALSVPISLQGYNFLDETLHGLLTSCVSALSGIVLACMDACGL